MLHCNWMLQSAVTQEGGESMCELSAAAAPDPSAHGASMERS